MAKQKKETGLVVDHDCYVTITREPYDGDDWDRGNTSTLWTVKDVALCKTEYPDVTAPFRITPGDFIYLVYAVWSSGDSFGRDESKNITFIDVFKSSEKAQKAIDAIEAHHKWYNEINNRWTPLTAKERRAQKKKYDSEYSVDYVRENGDVETCFANWHGYFESLSYIESEMFVITE